MASSQDFPTSVIARQVKALRRARSLTAEAMAARMSDVGVPFDKTVIANLETGRRRYVTVAELLALAYVLDVAPVHLLVPIDDETTPYVVAPGGPSVRPDIVRSWIRGQTAIGTVDVRKYASSVPAHEFGPDRNDRITQAYGEALQAEQAENEGALIRFDRDDITGVTFVRRAEPPDAGR